MSDRELQPGIAQLFAGERELSRAMVRSAEPGTVVPDYGCEYLRSTSRWRCADRLRLEGVAVKTRSPLGREKVLDRRRILIWQDPPTEHRNHSGPASQRCVRNFRAGQPARSMSPDGHGSRVHGKAAGRIGQVDHGRKTGRVTWRHREGFRPFSPSAHRLPTTRPW